MDHMSTVPAASGPTYRICFVCTGNICRSPVAEVVMRRLVEDDGLAGVVEVDSAGTGAWHVGHAADPRAVTSLRAGGYDGSGHHARVFEPAWIAERDLVVALDRGHLRELHAMATSETDRDKVRLLRSFDEEAPAGSDVADPYDGDARDFALVLAQVERACGGLLEQVARVLPGDRV
jgi:protein-tyrosine phosphatase